MIINLLQFINNFNLKPISKFGLFLVFLNGKVVGSLDFYDKKKPGRHMDLDRDQLQFIADVKQKIRQAQYEALKAVNTFLIDLYWELGRSITEKQAAGWGKSIVPKLSDELQKEFPGIGGLSAGNLWLMAQFYAEYKSDVNLLPLVREISWSKHIVILKKCKDAQERQFYILATKKFGWTKDVLTNQVDKLFDIQNDISPNQNNHYEQAFINCDFFTSCCFRFDLRAN